MNSLTESKLTKQETNGHPLAVLCAHIYYRQTKCAVSTYNATKINELKKCIRSIKIIDIIPNIQRKIKITWAYRQWH